MAQTSVDRGELTDRFSASEGCVGYRVHDPEGRKIGSVKELFRNAYGEPEYVRVRMGLFGLKSVLLPIGFVAVDEGRQTLTLQ